MATAKNYDREIGTIKGDIAAMGHLFGKLDTTLEKLEETASNISALLAVHEERLNSQEEAVSLRKREIDFDIKELHSRVTTAGRENQEQHRALTKEMKQSEEKILDAINELRKDVNHEQQRLESRITKLEQWRWVLLGILIALSALVPNLPKLFTLMS